MVAKNLCHHLMPLCATAMLVVVAVPKKGMAHSYVTEFVNMCPSPCDFPDNILLYQDNLVDEFQTHMNSYGNTLLTAQGNYSAYACDVVEDYAYGGCDYLLADRGDWYVLATHGSNWTNPLDPRGQGYYPRMCSPMSLPYQGYTCDPGSHTYRLGEQSGVLAQDHPGHLRWMVLLGCYGVSTLPYQQWGDAMYPGLDIVMGYRGTVTDTLDRLPVPGRLVDYLYGNGMNFKSAWHLAHTFMPGQESLIASGLSAADAQWRLDYYRVTWSRRAPSTRYPYQAWS